MSNTADVIIIGGGIQGTSLAFHLAQRGARAVVLEQRFIAAEATGRSSGLVRMHYDLELESQLAWVSFQYFRDWEQKVGIYRGATFNLAHNLGQMLHLRPRNRFEEFDRMYLDGGGTHPGSGLPVIFESARITSRLLLEDLGVAA